MADQPSMVIRISGNIDDLKAKLADGKAVIDGTAVSIQKLGKEAGGNAHAQFQKFDSILAALGINIGTDARALGELSAASGQTMASLGGMATAGLAAGAAFAGWKIGRWIAELGDLDEKIGNATAKMLGWGDVSKEIAENNMAVLARASKLVGFEVLSLTTATEILSGAAKDNADALNTSARRIEGWRMEIQKVKDAGTWQLLNADIKSQNFELKELSDRYGISVDAIQFFTRAQKNADDAIVESNQRKIAAMKSAAEAQREARAEAEKLTEATTHLQFAQGDFQTILNTTDLTLQESVRHYMDLGLSITDMSVLLGVSESKLGLVVTALSHQNDALEEAHAKWIALGEEQARVAAEMAARAEESAQRQIEAQRKVAEEAEKSYKQMMEMGNSETYDLSTDEGMAYFMKQNPAAKVNAPKEYFKTHSLADAIRAGLVDLYAGYTSKRYADGGTNVQGGMALVGERGPELVRLPQGADVIPNHQIGGAGGGALTVHVSVQGNVYGDGGIAALGRQLTAAMISEAAIKGFRIGAQR